jgi:hypothetical protein
MATDKAQQEGQENKRYDSRQGGTDAGDMERSGPSIQDQADSVLSGRATTVDTGATQGEQVDEQRADEEAKPREAAKSTSQADDSK